ncbi:HAD-IIA family hydrolase [Yoonia sp. MH D7]
MIKPSTKTLRLTSLDELEFSAVLSDLDGVVYRGENIIPGAAEQFAAWHRANIPYCFVTNNAEKSPTEFAAKVNRLGIICTADQVVTSGEVALTYTRAKYPKGTGVYVIGSDSFKARIESAGFEIVESGAAAVIVALDRKFDYAMMTQAALNILAGAELIGTNPDVIRPTADGYEPGTGALLASIASATSVKPLILGKPSGDILKTSLERIGADSHNAIMLGDQLGTDILAAQNAGIRGILIETGVPIDHQSLIQADYVIRSLVS